MQTVQFKVVGTVTGKRATPTNGQPYNYVRYVLCIQSPLPVSSKLGSCSGVTAVSREECARYIFAVFFFSRITFVWDSKERESQGIKLATQSGEIGTMVIYELQRKMVDVSVMAVLMPGF